MFRGLGGVSMMLIRCWLHVDGYLDAVRCWLMGAVLHSVYAISLGVVIEKNCGF